MPPDAGTPTKASARVYDSGAARNEEADIQLLCLRLFCQRELCTWRGQGTCTLARILPIANLGELGEIRVKLPAPAHIVRAVRGPTVADDAGLASLLARRLPAAYVNGAKASFADSILLLELDHEAPASIMPKGSQHRDKLAVFLQSKQHTASQQHKNESFTREYDKCARITCVPWIFVMISDAHNITFAKHVPLPFKGNGFFVGNDALEKLYGKPLFSIRAEEWPPVAVTGP